MAGNTSAGTEDLVLAWQRADEPGSVEFVVTSSCVEEVLGLLAEEDVSAAPTVRQVRGVGTDVLTTVVAVVENPAAWAAVGIAVKKFFDRHKGKRVRVDESGVIDASNYSARDLERIIRAVSDTEPDDESQ
jgi:hypothetical protein